MNTFNCKSLISCNSVIKMSYYKLKMVKFSVIQKYSEADNCDLIILPTLNLSFFCHRIILILYHLCHVAL